MVNFVETLVMRVPSLVCVSSCCFPIRFHGTFIIMNLAQNVLSVLSKCVCVCVRVCVCVTHFFEGLFHGFNVHYPTDCWFSNCLDRTWRMSGEEWRLWTVLLDIVGLLLCRPHRRPRPRHLVPGTMEIFSS